MIKDKSELYNADIFNNLRSSSTVRINNALNSSRSVLESARKCLENIPKSYKILSVIPGAIEAPKRDVHVIDDLCVAISKKYSSKLNSILTENGMKKSEIEIKSGINGIIEDWNILENNNAVKNTSDTNKDVNVKGAETGDGETNTESSNFKDFVTEAKAAEFVIRFLDRMQSKKFEMNYENVSLHVKGETQLERQLSAYPSFVAAISHASSGLSGIRRELNSGYSKNGSRDGGGTDNNTVENGGYAPLIGNFKNNKQIFERNPLVLLSQELERDILKERAPSWLSKYLPSIGTKLDYITMNEEKALSIYDKDKYNRDSILFRQYKLLPSAGRKGVRYNNIITGENNSKFVKGDTVFSDDGMSCITKNKKTQNQSGLQLNVDTNKIPMRFPWVLEQLPTSQSYKNQALSLNDSVSSSNDNSKEDKTKRSFYQKAKSLVSSNTFRQDNVIKAIVSNRGVAMVRNISMVPADSNLEAYFDELDDNSDNDNRYLWDDDYERRNCKTKEQGVQKYMEETSYDIQTINESNRNNIDELIKELEIKHKDLAEKRGEENTNEKKNSNSLYLQGYSKTHCYLESNSCDSKDCREILTMSAESNNMSKTNYSRDVGSFKHSSTREKDSFETNAGLSSEYDPNPKVKIEYDLSEIFDTNNTIYKGDGIKKTWDTYYESLRNHNKAIIERKKHMDEIHYNINLSTNRLNGSESRKSKIPTSFLPIHEYIMQESDPQEEYYKFVLGQRMIKESLNGFPLQESNYLKRTSELFNLNSNEDECSFDELSRTNCKLVGSNSKGYIRGLIAVRGGRRIRARLNSSIVSEHEKELRSRIEDIGFLKYNDKERVKFINSVRNINENKITKMYEMRNKLGVKTRISCRGRINRRMVS